MMHQIRKPKGERENLENVLLRAIVLRLSEKYEKEVLVRRFVHTQ